MEKYRPFLIIAFVLVVAIIGGVLLMKRGNEGFNGYPEESPDSSTTASPEPTRKIPADVVVTLEEFGDYQCQPCAQLHPALKKMKQDFGRNLNFIFRNLPLEEIHKNALAAAQAAEAARMQNRFWEMHDLLYENQDIWKDEERPKRIFTKFASNLGLDLDRFARDMESEQVRMRIQADKDATVRLGITGTPTVFIDGRKLKVEATTAGGIRKGIEYTISQKMGTEY